MTIERYSERGAYVPLSPPTPEGKQRAIEFLRRWVKTPDNRGKDYWDEFEREVLECRNKPNTTR